MESFGISKNWHQKTAISRVNINYMHWFVGSLFLFMPMEGFLMKAFNHVLSSAMIFEKYNFYFLSYLIIAYTFIDHFKSVYQLIKNRSVISRLINLWLIFGMISFIFSNHGEVQLSLFLSRYLIPYLFSALIINYPFEFKSAVFLIAIGTIVVGAITLYKYLCLFGVPLSGYDIIKNKGMVSDAKFYLNYSFIGFNVTSTSFAVLFLLSFIGSLIEKRKLEKWIMSLSMTISFICTLWIFSRGSLFAILIACILIALVLKRKKILYKTICTVAILFCYFFIDEQNLIFNYFFPVSKITDNWIIDSAVSESTTLPPETLKTVSEQAQPTLEPTTKPVETVKTASEQVESVSEPDSTVPVSVKKESISASNENMIKQVLKEDDKGFNPFSSAEQRLLFLKSGLQFLKENKKAILIGDVNAFNTFLLNKEILPKELFSIAMDYSHNLFVSLMINGGILSLGTIIFCGLYSFYLAFSREKETLQKLLFFVLIAISIMGILTGYALSAQGIIFNGFAIWFIIIVIEKTKKMRSSNS